MSIISQIKPILKRRWMTIPSIQSCIDTYAMETTISARIRDLRKAQYGSHNVERRLKRGTKLYEYKIQEG